MQADRPSTPRSRRDRPKLVDTDEIAYNGSALCQQVAQQPLRKRASAMYFLLLFIALITYSYA